MDKTSDLFPVQKLIAALQEIDKMPGSTVAERFFRASKLRAVRTDLSAIIKAEEPAK